MDEQELEDYLARFRIEADGLLASLEADEIRVVRTDRYDDQAFAQAMTDGDLDDRMEHYKNRESYVEEFYADLFALLTKASPSIRQAAEMTESRRPNHTMIEAFWGYDELQGLRDFTIGDTGGATLAMISLDSEIAALYEAMRRARELAQQREEQRAAAADKVGEALDGLSDGSLTPEEADTLLAEAKALAEQTSQDQVDNNLPRPKDLAEAAEKAREELQNERDLFSAYGVEPGDLKRMPFEERRRLAERLKRNRMAAYASFIGQFKPLADANVRRRVTANPDEIVGIEMSDRLQDLVPAEMMAMAEPGLDGDFWRRYTEHDVTTYRKQGVEQVGRGPMIVVGDESESMSRPFGGATREAWMKAVALALADTCRRERRDFYYVGFSSPTQMWSIDLTPGKPDYLARVVQFTEHFYCGGTDFNAPLLRAIEIAKGYTGQKRPDFVLLSDGAGRLSSENLQTWTEYRQSSGSRSWGLGIGHFNTQQMAAMCDDVRSVLDMTDSREHLIDLFRQI